MCYAAPGPRCSGHAAEYIEQAQIVLHDAVEERQRYQAKFSLGECSSDEYEERNIALREARAALDDHVLQFQETPAYWKAAEQKAGRTKIPRMRYELEN